MIDYFKKIIIVKEKSSHRKVKGSVKIIKEKKKIQLYVDLISNDVDFTDCVWQLCGDEKTVLQNMQNALKFDYPLNDDFHFFKGASFCVYNKVDKDVLCYGEYGVPCLKEKEVIKNERIENDCEYDDEIIATENYYQKENEELFFKQINCAKNANNEKEQEKEISFKPFQYEKDFGGIKETFFKGISGKLNDLFNSHEKITALNEVVEGGSFIKVNYDNVRSYIVGKIEEKGKVKYILYGIKGSYENPPENFYDKAKFIPESEFNLQGAGYYFIFQDGNTGEII